MKYIISVVIISSLALVASANSDSSYIGQEKREIKALSQQETVDYLNGKGLGYAKAAELNHFPGPSHVLSLAKELNLTVEQTRLTQAAFNKMKTQAISLGGQFVKKEQELDRLFANGSIDTESLNKLLSEIGTLQANIRYTHLSAHLEQQAILTTQQIKLYDQLRGYGNFTAGEHQHSH